MNTSDDLVLVNLHFTNEFTCMFRPRMLRELLFCQSSQPTANHRTEESVYPHSPPSNLQQEPPSKQLRAVKAAGHLDLTCTFSSACISPSVATSYASSLSQVDAVVQSKRETRAEENTLFRQSLEHLNKAVAIR